LSFELSSFGYISEVLVMGTNYDGTFSKAVVKGFIDIPEKTAPGTPDTDVGRLYVADDGGTTKLYFKNPAGLATALTDAATVTWDAIGDAGGAGTVAFGTNAQVITAAKTNGDMLTISGIGNFGDVSVVRIESSTGNPTDGTVLEVVSHDANTDPLVVSSSAQAGVLVVAQDGSVAVTGNQTITGTLSATGGLIAGTATNSIQKTDTVALTNANIKALRATKKALVATPGADKFLEFVSAQLILNYGSEVLTESSDDLVIQYATSGVDATAAITANGFITAAADTIINVLPKAMGAVVATNLVNNGLELFNTGDGEYGGNASADTTMTVKITYRIHTAGL
jgi:hypothetical protein